ncbi:hypothetical protein BDN72DRAFT_835272 [Pluteus cervinus]|uniref:Uncharacterized protein n=1 Tax=Pluteus cervinus TaxID=181527 RepID=A0ACD3B4U9_9AGAR|nr:hypothetical protein BDN72DRAFT_835272 [Pluteus cervinus]
MCDSNGFRCPPSGDDGGGGGDETIMSMMFTVTVSFEQDYDFEREYDSGAGTGRVDITCALASFIVTVVDIEEKGYDGVLALAGVCIGVVRCDEDWRILRRRLGFVSFEGVKKSVEHAHRMMTRTSLPKGRECLRDGRRGERSLLGISLEGRGLNTPEEGFGRILALDGKP